MHFVIMPILQCFMAVLLRSLLTTISQLYVLDAVGWKDDELRVWHLPFLSYIKKKLSSRNWGKPHNHHDS